MSGINRRNKIMAVVFLIIVGIVTVGTFKNIYNVKDLKISKNNMKKAISDVDNILNENVYNKMEFIEFNGLVQRSMNKKVVEDVESWRTVIKDKNNYLHFNLISNPIDLTKQTESIVKLRDFTKKNNIDFMYVQSPFKFTGEQGQLPTGVNDYSNDVADKFLENLRENNINTLDLREEMKKDNIDYKDAFFKTDHHWKPKTGFWATGELINKLNSDYEMNLDKDNRNRDINNYEEINYNKNFVGSQGKRVGKYYTEIDDFSMYIPKFDTDLTVTKYNNDSKVMKTKKGSFDDTIIEKSLLKGSIYENKYAAYLGGDNEFRIINNKVNNNKKVLIIKDSFVLPVASYLSLSTKETRVLDLRYYNGKEYDYIKNYNPDIVIMMYYPGSLPNMKTFDFK